MPTLKCRGDFGGEPRGPTEIVFFPHLAHVALSSLRLETANFAIYPHAPRTSFICGYIVSASMAVFASTIAINAEQLANSPHLEPAFEHLLRNSNVHESIISTLRINAVTDRDTFVIMFDSEAALKEGASDLGFDWSAGGLRTSGNLQESLQVGKQQRS